MIPFIPKVASDALELKKYLKNHEINPEKVFTKMHYNEKTKLWVFTYQAGFKTEKEAEMFLKFNNVLKEGLFFE